MDTRLKEIYTKGKGTREERMERLEEAYTVFTELCVGRAAEVYETRREYLRKRRPGKEKGWGKDSEIGREKGRVVWTRRALCAMTVLERHSKGLAFVNENDGAVLTSATITDRSRAR